jgi:iron complex outermembrane receptor protein
MTSYPRRALQRRLISVACQAALAAAAHAQAQTEAPEAVQAPVAAQAPVATPSRSAEKAQMKVVITGSQIRRIDAEGSLPVQVITERDIRNSGKTTLTEVLQTLSANGANGMTDASSFDSFAYGAAGVSLRALGPTATLVLINGRRIASYSVPDSNTGRTSFVNVDAIPLAAVARIEVLKDGASAIYGSDAMAGVINVILRTDYNGAQIDANATSNSQGRYGEKWAGLTFGKGSLDEQGWNWLTSIDLYKRDQVMLRDVKDEVIDARHRDNPFYYTGRPYNNIFAPVPNYFKWGTIDWDTGVTVSPAEAGVRSQNCPSDNHWAFNNNFDPPLDLCGFTYADVAQYVTPRERASLFSSGQLAAGGLTLFGEVSLTRSTNKKTDWPNPYGVGLSATPNGRDGGMSFMPQFLPTGHPNNPFSGQPAGIAYLFSDVGNQRTDVTNTAGRLLGGVRGLVGEFDWETAVMYARDQTRVDYRNMISLPALRDAVLSGDYDFEHPAAGRITAKDLRVEPTDKGYSEFLQVDGKINGALLQLPAGELGVAGGLELRQERRNYTPDERIWAGEVLQLTAGRSSGRRQVASAFTEFDVPVTRELRAQLAARADHYSDYGNSLTPKIAVAWTPVREIKVRGSAASGFRAPSLVESDKTDFPSFNYLEFDRKRCGQFNVDCGGYPISGVLRANPNLQPEKSRSYTLGLVLEPRVGTTLAMDYWQVERRNEISRMDFDTILRNEDGGDPMYAGRVTRMPGDTVPGRVTSVEMQFVNLGRTQTRGVDLDLDHSQTFDGRGRLRIHTNFTYLDRFRSQGAEGSSWTVYTGYMNNPRVRGSLTAEWVADGWNAGTTVNYLSGMRSYYAGHTCDMRAYIGVCGVPEYKTLDLFGGWRLSRNVRLYGSLRNALNTRMPFAPTEPTGNRYWYSPTGPLLRVGAQYTF